MVVILPGDEDSGKGTMEEGKKVGGFGGRVAICLKVELVCSRAGEDEGWSENSRVGDSPRMGVWDDIVVKSRIYDVRSPGIITRQNNMQPNARSSTYWIAHTWWDTLCL